MGKNGLSAWCVKGYQVGSCLRCASEYLAQFSEPVSCGKILQVNRPFRHCHGIVDSCSFHKLCVSDLCLHEGLKTSHKAAIFLESWFLQIVWLCLPTDNGSVKLITSTIVGMLFYVQHHCIPKVWRVWTNLFFRFIQEFTYKSDTCRYLNVKFVVRLHLYRNSKRVNWIKCAYYLIQIFLLLYH